MLKAKELRDQSIEDLEERKRVLGKELFDFINEKRLANKNEKPHLLRQKRKDIARVLTVLREKQGS